MLAEISDLPIKDLATRGLFIFNSYLFFISFILVQIQLLQYDGKCPQGDDFTTSIKSEICGSGSVVDTQWGLMKRAGSGIESVI